MARRLVKLGHEVTVITSFRTPTRTKGWFSTLEDGITVHWIPILYSNSMSFGQRLLAFVKFGVLGGVKAASVPADVVYATSTPLTVAIPGALASFWQRAPLVLEIRDLWPQVPIALRVLKNPLGIGLALALEKFAYNRAKAIIALAPGMRQRIIDDGYDPNCIGVIPNASDVVDDCKYSGDEKNSFRDQYPWLGDGKLFVYTGTFGHVNDLHFMVDLAAECHLLRPTYRFVAIGDGACHGEVIAYAEKKGVLNVSVFFLGALAKIDAFKWLANSDGVLVLYKGPKIVWEDCTSNKLFDSFAVGKPVIANISGWGVKVAEEAGAGLILCDKEIVKSALSLVKNVEDPIWVESAQMASKELAKKYFDRDLLTNKLEKVLRSVVDGRAEDTAVIAPAEIVE